jgi:hypothetical protein
MSSPFLKFQVRKKLLPEMRVHGGPASPEFRPVYSPLQQYVQPLFQPQ